MRGTHAPDVPLRCWQTCEAGQDDWKVKQEIRQMPFFWLLSAEWQIKPSRHSVIPDSQASPSWGRLSGEHVRPIHKGLAGSLQSSLVSHPSLERQIPRRQRGFAGSVQSAPARHSTPAGKHLLFLHDGLEASLQSPSVAHSGGRGWHFPSRQSGLEASLQSVEVVHSGLISQRPALQRSPVLQSRSTWHCEAWQPFEVALQSQPSRQSPSLWHVIETHFPSVESQRLLRSVQSLVRLHSVFGGSGVQAKAHREDKKKKYPNHRLITSYLSIQQTDANPVFVEQVQPRPQEAYPWPGGGSGRTS